MSIVMKRPFLLAFLAAFAAAPAHGQEGVSATCARSEIPNNFRSRCLIVAQAVQSAQPQLGVLITGGNPTPGSASAGGLRLGLLPRVSATGKVNLVLARVPDILESDGGGELAEEIGIPVPALSGTATIGLFPGLSLAPTLGGIGSVDLLAGATWLPIGALDTDGFAGDSDDLALGFGARVGLLRESFTVPGVSLSLMYHRLGSVRYGNVCESASVAGTGNDFERGVCPGAGDPGEFAAAVNTWSARAVVGKRLLGLGLTAGLGYDRSDSEVDFGFRAACAPVGPESCYFRSRSVRVVNGRRNAFVNASFTALVATFSLEGGWMQGDEPIEGFPADASDFDPEAGTFFGSLGIRLGL